MNAPGSHIADLIINTRAGTKEAACKGRRVWQPGLKCPLMNFFGTCILATHFITSWCSWTGHTVIYPPGSPDSLSLVVDGGMYRPCFPKAVFASLCFVSLMKKAHMVLGARDPTGWQGLARRGPRSGPGRWAGGSPGAGLPTSSDASTAGRLVPFPALPGFGYFYLDSFCA